MPLQEFILDEALPQIDASLNLFAKKLPTDSVINLERDAVIDSLRSTVQQVAGVRHTQLTEADEMFKKQAAEIRQRLEVSKKLQQERTARTEGVLQVRAQQRNELRSLLRHDDDSTEDPDLEDELTQAQESRSKEIRRAYAQQVVRNRSEHEKRLEALLDSEDGEPGAVCAGKAGQLRDQIRQTDEDIAALTAKLSSLRSSWEQERDEKSAAMQQRLAEVNRRANVKIDIPGADLDAARSLSKLAKEKEQLRTLIDKEKRRKVYLSAKNLKG